MYSKRTDEKNIDCIGNIEQLVDDNLKGILNFKTKNTSQKVLLSLLMTYTSIESMIMGELNTRNSIYTKDALDKNKLAALVIFFFDLEIFQREANNDLINKLREKIYRFFLMKYVLKSDDNQMIDSIFNEVTHISVLFKKFLENSDNSLLFIKSSLDLKLKESEKVNNSDHDDLILNSVFIFLSMNAKKVYDQILNTNQFKLEFENIEMSEIDLEIDRVSNIQFSK